MPVQSDNLATEVHALVDYLRKLKPSCLKSQPINSNRPSNLSTVARPILSSLCPFMRKAVAKRYGMGL
jgi:hypothetical protein